MQLKTLIGVKWSFENQLLNLGGQADSIGIECIDNISANSVELHVA
jgi:hypothetical protein